jgi:hypothetical protein
LIQRICDRTAIDRVIAWTTIKDLKNEFRTTPNRIVMTRATDLINIDQRVIAIRT